MPNSFLLLLYLRLNRYYSIQKGGGDLPKFINFSHVFTHFWPSAIYDIYVNFRIRLMNHDFSNYLSLFV